MPRATGTGDAWASFISNLIGNAALHGAGTALVHLRVRSRAVWNSACTTTGKSPASLLPQLFEPFARAGGRRPPHRGLGLGLHIAQQIARAHGAEIRVSSSFAHVTRFTLRLPRSSSFAPQ